MMYLWVPFLMTSKLLLAFLNISSAAAALSNWSVLVRKDSVRILPIANQKEVISSRDAFKAKLVNFLFSCTAFEISDLVSQVGNRTCFIPCSSESYRNQHFAVVIFDSLESLNVAVSKTGTLHGCHIWWETPGCCHCYRCQDLNHLATAAFVILPGAAAANMELDLGGPPKTATSVLSVVSSVPNTAVESRLAFFESHLSELSVLIKSLVEPVGALVALVTKLLSTPSAMDVSVKECVNGLAKQNKGLAAVATMMQKRLTRFETISEWICLENGSDVNDMVDDVDDDDDDDKAFSVYDNTFNVMMHLWEDQPLRIKSSPDQTAKWMSDMVKNSHELVSIMGKMYELDMFDTLGSKGSTSLCETTTFTVAQLINNQHGYTLTKKKVDATGKSTSQLEENPFYIFNLTNNDHNIDELAINTSESTRKKKKAKVDFILDSNKASTSTVDNIEPPKTKVFKNSLKLKSSEIVQKSGSYFVVKDLMEISAYITFGQFSQIIDSKEENTKDQQALLSSWTCDNSNVTPLIYKAQVNGYFIDLILDSRSSVSVIAKHFLEAIRKKIDEPSIQPIVMVETYTSY
ncbi:hypothetical protein G9A89_005572 [Geosiphon pyriformis]|nr:hypothetical protein G9A89_005572 [Geosiphon pyriformis]